MESLNSLTGIPYVIHGVIVSAVILGLASVFIYAFKSNPEPPYKSKNDSKSTTKKKKGKDKVSMNLSGFLQYGFVTNSIVTYLWPLTFCVCRNLLMEPPVLPNLNQKVVAPQKRSPRVTMRRTRKTIRWRIPKIPSTRRTRKKSRSRMKFLRRKEKRTSPLTIRRNWSKKTVISKISLIFICRVGFTN